MIDSRPPAPWSPTLPGAVRVPAVTAVFWLLKALSTALGESTSDWSVKAFGPVPAVLGGMLFFLAAVPLQLHVRRYVPTVYWAVVVAVGVFGTMCADVVHVGLGVPYLWSSAGYLTLLTVVLVTWRRVEGTLDVHEITTTRRELFYWATVVATFAAGTALGDLLAVTAHLGYAGSVLVFALALSVPALGYRYGRWNPVAAFWTAYVLTRPLGASLADWAGKPVHEGGLGVGQGTVTAVLAAAITLGVLAHGLTWRAAHRPTASAAGSANLDDSAGEPPRRVRRLWSAPCSVELGCWILVPPGLWEGLWDDVGIRPSSGAR